MSGGLQMNRLLSGVENLAAFFLLLIALLVTANVTLRYLFSCQIPDWFDFSRQLQAIAIFWGIALTTYRASHICVDVVWEHLGKRGPAGARPARHHRHVPVPGARWPG